MLTRKISAYMDMNLTQKLEAMVLNLLPEITHSSDMVLLYLAETDVVDDNGEPTQTKVTSEDTFFVSIINDGGFIDFSSIKMLHIPETLASDFDYVEYMPSLENMKYFSTYYQGREVPETGGYMDYAFSPFAPNQLELLNGDLVNVHGRGRMWITPEQRGLKGYKKVPRVREILSSDYFKILKLAIYATYEPDLGSTLSMNFFSPSMEVEQHQVGERLELTSDVVGLYATSKNANFGEFGGIVDQKTDTILPCKGIERGMVTELHGIDERVYVKPDGYINCEAYKANLQDEFSIHQNFVVREYARRGTVIFEIGYAKGSATHFTRSVSVWLNKDGYIMYNTSFVNEATNTGVKVLKDIENTLTFTVSNEKYDEDDDDEYVSFIHLNGEQVWPKEEMIYEYQRDYFWKALGAFRIYNDVCMELPAPPPVTGGVDAREICVKKLLHESGFVTKDALDQVYSLYQKRPRASASDFNTTKLNYISTDPDNLYDSTVDQIVFGQDAYMDTEDSSFYADIEFSEILICNGRLTRKQIELTHLSNTVKVASVST